MSQHPSPEWVKPLIYINLNSESGNLVGPKKKTETRPHSPVPLPAVCCPSGPTSFLTYQHPDLKDCESVFQRVAECFSLAVENSVLLTHIQK